MNMEREYRRLKKGEIILEGDEIDSCVDAWRDDPAWEPAVNIGEPAPDPQYLSHRQYRRPTKKIADRDAEIEKLERQVKSLERIIVKARREFRMGGDPIEARAWLFRIDIDESKVNDE